MGLAGQLKREVSVPTQLTWSRTICPEPCPNPAQHRAVAPTCGQDRHIIKLLITDTEPELAMS